MSEELRFHLEQYTDDLVRSGVPPEEAARRARIEFGSLTSVQEECREARGLHLFDELLRQLRYAVRLLRKTPGFTATALLTLAVCLGANLTIFAVIDSILLRPLPFPESGRLVTVFNTYPKAGVDRDGSSLTNYYERRGRIPAFSVARDLPRRHGDRRRDRLNGTRTDHARVAGVFLHPWARPRDGARFHGSGDHLSNRPGRDSDRRLLAAALQCRPPRDRQADPRGRRCQDRGRGPAARLPLPLVRSAALLSARRRVPKIAVPGSGIRAGMSLT